MAEYCRDCESFDCQHVVDEEERIKQLEAKLAEAKEQVEYCKTHHELPEEATIEGGG